MRSWKRADGATVTLSEYSDIHGPASLYVYGRNQRRVLHRLYEYWEHRQAREDAEELADLLGCEEVHAEVDSSAA